MEDLAAMNRRHALIAYILIACTLVLALIARASGGLTRRINIYADKTLLAAARRVVRRPPDGADGS